jgi:ABC-type spermidine/putrescine transport system permease subunit I
VIGVNALKVDDQWSLGNFVAIATERPYPRLFWNTLQISFEVTIACLLLSLPISVVASRGGTRLLAVIILGITASFWISILVRTYGWIIILGHNGPLNALAQTTTGRPLELLYSRPGTLIVLVNVMLPHLALPLTAFAVRAIDWTLIDAAYGLGASKLRTFWSVLLPQLYPGIVASSALTFVISLGFFVTPRLVGGVGDSMISMQIDRELNSVFDRERASALSFALLALIALIVAAFAAVAGFQGIRSRRRETSMHRLAEAVS